jgi:hypothetical protein
MMCDRCARPIRGAYDEFAPETGSGAAATVVMHKGGCLPAKRQRYPEPPVVLAPPTPRSRQRRRPHR